MSNSEILLHGTTTPATSLVFAATAGTPTASQTLDVWWRRGLTGATAKNCSLQVEVYDTVTSSWKIQGLEPLDRAWFRARVTGYSNPGNAAAFEQQTTGWTALGTGRRLLMLDLMQNTARWVEVEIQAPLDEGAASASFSWRLVFVLDDISIPIAEGAAYGASGILTGVGDGNIREWVTRVVPVTHGTATIEIPIRGYVWDGIRRNEPETAFTFTDQDVASASLASGEEYQALVYQGATGAAAVIKGAKAVAGSSVSPALPADKEAGWLVTVPYGLAIGDGNIVNLTTAGRFEVRAGTGLAIVVGSGRALLPGAMVRRTDETSLAVTDDDDTYVWLGAAGTVLTTTEEVAPDTGAEELAKVTAASGAITAIVDKRRFWEPNAQLVQLTKSGVLSASADSVDWEMIPYRWNLDRVLGAVGIVGGTAGATTLDLYRRGSADGSLFTSGLEVKVPYNGLTATALPTTTEGEAGDWLELQVTAIPTTAGPTNGGLTAVIYPR